MSEVNAGFYDRAMELFDDYMEKFGRVPQVTVIRMPDSSKAQPFIDATKKAIDDGKPLSEKEWAKVEREVFGDAFDGGVLT